MALSNKSPSDPPAPYDSPPRDQRAIWISLLDLSTIESRHWSRIAHCISHDEFDRAGRFAHEADRHAHLAAHWLKRRMLSQSDPSVDPLAWRFSKGQHGKPEIAGEKSLHFNLSHCHGLVACAVRHDHPVGIDVEYLGRPAPTELVAHAFSSSEADWWWLQPESERHKAFFQNWTLKEAYIKATGLGLSQPLRDFTIIADTLVLRTEDGADHTSSWQFYQADVGQLHVLAAAWCAPCKSESVEVVQVHLDAWL